MKKAVFLDRDGVINKVCYHHDQGIYSAKNIDEFIIIPGVKEAILELKKEGFLIIIVTNQPGFAFGYLKEEEITKINTLMKKELGVDEVYMCRHSAEENCGCRKPKDALFLAAAKDFGIELSRSYNVGDNISDMLAGKKCRKNILIGKKQADLFSLLDENKIKPDTIVSDLKEAAKKIKQWESSSKFR